LSLKDFIEGATNKVTELLIDPDAYDIRFTYIPIYDCYWYFLIAAANSCEIDQSKLNYANLRQSWNEIRERLEKYTPNAAFQRWNQIINEISGFRNIFAHNPTKKAPTIDQIKKCVSSIKSFSEWLPEILDTYIQNLPSYQAALTFNGVIENYIWQAGFIYLEIGDKVTPRIVKDNYLFTDLFDYHELPKRIEEVRKIMEQLIHITELTQPSFEKIIQLLRYISLLEGSYHANIELYKCPVCDGMIEETSIGYGDTPDDPEPTGISIRVGCDTCDFSIMEDTI